MNLTILPGKLTGSVIPPASKSVAHRALLASSLAGGTSVLTGVSPSQDMDATCNCGRLLGAEMVVDGEKVTVTGGKEPVQHGAFDCGESGSTLRFVIPLASVLCDGGTFTGHGRLMERPQSVYETLFANTNIPFGFENGNLVLSGTLPAGVYNLAGDVSSQFLTGLLFALPLCQGDSRIHLTTPLESAGYVDITLDVLHQFGITIQVEGRDYIIPGNQAYLSQDMGMERDYSQAAFFYVANALGSTIAIQGMREDSVQGDKAILEIIDRISKEDTPVIDVRQVPDLMPVVTVLAALQPGKTTQIVGGERLRIKESDRIATTSAGIRALGGKILENPDGVTVFGQASLPGGTVDCANDHRIAMAMAICSTCCEGPVHLEGAQCVKKSYPDFWQDFKALGGNVQ